MPIEGPPLISMAKAGGSLSANTNAEVLGADMQRQTVFINNLSTNQVIYIEFGAAASTTASDGSWALNHDEPPLILSVEDFPEIRNSINLKSTGTPQYVVRTA